MKFPLPPTDCTNIAFDLDSTLVTIEGIDELARLKGVTDEVSKLTKRAMEGELPFEEVFMKRLTLVQPTKNDLTLLGAMYEKHIIAGAHELIELLQSLGKRIFVITASYNPAAACVARRIGVRQQYTFANELVFDHHGNFVSCDTAIPLWKADGKIQILRQLRRHYDGGWVFVGDSMSDLETSVKVDHFICFAGVAKREKVLKKADCIVFEKNLLSLAPYLVRE